MRGCTREPVRYAGLEKNLAERVPAGVEGGSRASEGAEEEGVTRNVSPAPSQSLEVRMWART